MRQPKVVAGRRKGKNRMNTKKHRAAAKQRARREERRSGQWAS